MPFVLILWMGARFLSSSFMPPIIIHTIYINHFKIILSIFNIILIYYFIHLAKKLGLHLRCCCQNFKKTSLPASDEKRAKTRDFITAIKLRACGPPCTHIRFAFIYYVYIILLLNIVFTCADEITL